MDKVDREILQLLTDNGKKLGLSRVAVRERVNRLVENGVIEQFTAVINSSKAGKEVSAFFEIDCEPSSLVKIAEALAENPNVASCYQMTGPSTLHTHVLVDNFEVLEHLLMKNYLYSKQSPELKATYFSEDLKADAV